MLFKNKSELLQITIHIEIHVSCFPLKSLKGLGVATFWILQVSGEFEYETGGTILNENT